MASSVPRYTRGDQGISRSGRGSSRVRRRRCRSTILAGLPAAITRDVGDAAPWRDDQKRRARERRQAAERERSLRCADEADDEPATLGANTDHEADGQNRISEMAKTEWGVADERGQITTCESEQAARQLQAASGGELVYRRTWITTWS
jgi:hypothetical protein